MPGHTRQFNWYNLWVCWLVSLGQVAFGYPASIISTTLGEPSFLVYMKLINAKTGIPAGDADSLEGAMSGVFQVRQPLRMLFSPSTDHGKGRSIRRGHARELCHGQVGKKGWCYILLFLVPLGWRSIVWLEKLDNVYHCKIVRGYGKLGLFGSQ
jgi:hypothetical protein